MSFLNRITTNIGLIVLRWDGILAGEHQQQCIWLNRLVNYFMFLMLFNNKSFILPRPHVVASSSSYSSTFHSMLMITAIHSAQPFTHQPSTQQPIYASLAICLTCG